MTGNPYQSPNRVATQPNVTPNWYVWFAKAYWPTWCIGCGLVVASWAGLVTPTIGWIGFCVACAASFLSYILPTLAGIKPQHYVILDSRILRERGPEYRSAIERFQNGGTLMYDGVAFGFRPTDVIACGLLAPPGQLDDASAMELASHAQSVFDKLVMDHAEFASAVADHTLRISIMRGSDYNAKELCRIVDGKLEWVS